VFGADFCIIAPSLDSLVANNVTIAPTVDTTIAGTKEVPEIDVDEEQ
jgi:hypothetical protein